MDKGAVNTQHFELLSIVVDDFDSTKKTCFTDGAKDERKHELPVKSIQKILQEAEHRKLEFWKLIDEHNAVVEKLKRIEGQGESSRSGCKVRTVNINPVISI